MTPNTPLEQSFKLVVLLYCHDGEPYIPTAIALIPRAIAGVTDIKVIVLDDASRDDSLNAAWQAGAEDVLHNIVFRGLANTLQTGIDAGLSREADAIIISDVSSLSDSQDIANLITPILARKADIVVGNSYANHDESFPLTTRLANWIVRTTSKVASVDSLSVFRAYSREAALRLFVTSKYSYPVQSLIQAGKQGLTVLSVPVKVFASELPHRKKVESIGLAAQHIAIFLRTSVAYAPIKTFAVLSMPVLLIGVILLIRLVIIAAVSGTLTGNLQSLIFGVLSTTTGLLLIVTGIIVDRIQENRRLFDEMLYRIRSGRDI